MKKTYIEPSVMVANIRTSMMICVSDGVTSGGDAKGIDYGGVDEEGVKDPASRRQYDVWEDEEMEE